MKMWNDAKEEDRIDYVQGVHGEGKGVLFMSRLCHCFKSCPPTTAFYETFCFGKVLAVSQGFLWEMIRQLCVRCRSNFPQHVRAFTTKTPGLASLDLTNNFGAAPDALPLVIVHGLLGQGRNWASIGRHQSIGGRRRTLAVDLRNHGDSPHFPTMTLQEMGEDIIRVMDKEGMEEAIVLGHSLGGRVAMALAHEWPERVAGLVVVDVAPGEKMGDPFARKEIRELLQALCAMDLSAVQSITDADKKLAEASITDADKKLAEAGVSVPYVRSFALKNLQRKKDGSGFKWRANVPVLFQAFQTGVLSKYKYHKNELLESLPTLFLRGELSRYVTELDHGLIADLFPRANIVTVPKAGHWCHMEQPVFLTQQLAAFCDQIVSMRPL
eukprot:g35719.t1